MELRSNETTPLDHTPSCRAAFLGLYPTLPISTHSLLSSHLPTIYYLPIYTLSTVFPYPHSQLSSHLHTRSPLFPSTQSLYSLPILTISLISSHLCTLPTLFPSLYSLYSLNISGIIDEDFIIKFKFLSNFSKLASVNSSNPVCYS